MHVDGILELDRTRDTNAASSVIAGQVQRAHDIGLDRVWTTEVDHDPFLPLAMAAVQSGTLELGTAVAVAFARSPMTMAVAANDLQAFSGGRFTLGLGSQIKAHIERRFSMPWSAPAERMREYIAALQAIWHSWQTGEKLDFHGPHYEHSLMTPMFTPRPHTYGRPAVVLAAVGQRMTAVAAECADGLVVHSFTSARYLREVTTPIIAAGLDAGGRSRRDFSVCYPGLIATGTDEKNLRDNVELVRKQIAFYGATPAYRGVLDLHGLSELHLELHRLSKAGNWTAMTHLIDDDVLTAFALVGEPTAVGRRVTEEFGDLIDRFTISTPYPLDAAAMQAIAEGIRLSS